MAYVERTDEEIIAAWERLLDRHPRPDDKSDQRNCFILYGKLYSPREMVEALRSGHAVFIEMQVHFFRAVAKKHNEDPVDVLDNDKKLSL